MAAAGKWCPHALGDVVTVLLTDSPDTAAVRRQAARIAKVQLREPDIYFRRETGALGARPMSPGGAQDALHDALKRRAELLAPSSEKLDRDRLRLAC